MAHREEYLDGSELAPGYCRAVKIDNMIFISGTVGLNENGEPAGPDVKTQTRAIYKKIETCLEHFGATLEDVAHVNMYLTDMDQLGDLQAVQGEVFPKIRPAATLAGVSSLIAGMSIEINVQAIV